jgi:hypothetical protein
MRALVTVVAMAVVALMMGCVTDQRAYRFCDLKPEEWTILPAPPPRADEALSMIKMGPAGFTRIVWFESGDHRFAVCQLSPPPQGYCGLRRLLLRLDSGRWQSAEEGDQLEMIGICG